MSSDNIYSIESLAERNHREFMEREVRRVSRIGALGGVEVMDMSDRNPDGTRKWSDWCALLDKPEAKP